MSNMAMNGPGIHEDNAVGLLAHGKTQEAQVAAILALASAVNRLAEAHEDLVRSYQWSREG